MPLVKGQKLDIPAPLEFGRIYPLSVLCDGDAMQAEIRHELLQVMLSGLRQLA